MGTTIDTMARHYRESVEMIERSEPDCEFLALLRTELASVPAITGSGGGAASGDTARR